MTFRNVGPGFDFPDHTRPIAGDEGTTISQSDDKLVTRTGAAKAQADVDVKKDVISNGDFETGVVDIGGTSGVAIALESNDNNAFEVKLEQYGDTGDLRTTIDSNDFGGLAGEVVTEVIPVFSDKVKIIVTDTSGGASNTVTGSLNANIGTPTQLSAAIKSGAVKINDPTGATIDPSQATDFPDKQVSGEDLTVDDTVIGPVAVDRSGSLAVAVNETSGGTMDVTITWEDSNGNVYQKESPSDLELSGVTEDWARVVRKGPQARITLSNNTGASSTNAHVDTQR